MKDTAVAEAPPVEVDEAVNNEAGSISDSNTPVAPDDAELRAENNRLRRHDEEIRDQERAVAVAESEWEEAKAYASARKADFEAAVVKLRAIIRSRDEGTLFDGAPGDNGHETPVVDAWRSVTVDELDLPEKLREKLHEAFGESCPDGKATLGKIADYTNRPGQWLTDITGIGAEKDRQISEAMTAWFAAHPEMCPAVKDGGKAECMDVKTSTQNGLPEPGEGTLLEWHDSDEDPLIIIAQSAVDADGKPLNYVIEPAGTGGKFKLEGDTLIVPKSSQRKRFDEIANAKNEAEYLERKHRGTTLTGGGVPGAANVGDNLPPAGVPTFEDLGLPDPVVAVLTSNNLNDFGAFVTWASYGNTPDAINIAEPWASKLMDAAKATQTSTGEPSKPYEPSANGKPKRRKA